MTITDCDYSNHTFSTRDKLEKYAEFITGSQTLNHIYGSAISKRLRFLSEKGKMKSEFNATEVYLNLYIGDVYAAHNTVELKKRGFTHIVNCVPNVVPAFPSDFKYLYIPLLDCATEAISELFNSSSDFIHDALSNHGRVLVHCVKGMSRSATITSAYIMKALHVSPREAVSVIQSKRGVVKPNYGFMIQLEIYGQQIAKDFVQEHTTKEQEALSAGKSADVAAEEGWRRASVGPVADSHTPHHPPHPPPPHRRWFRSSNSVFPIPASTSTSISASSSARTTAEEEEEWRRASI